jgi:transcriptional regulator with PAS, ATPase and Fis domain
MAQYEAMGEGRLDEDPFLAIHLPGSTAAMKELRAKVQRLNTARNQVLVNVILIRGESGAGKSHLARVIAAHRAWLIESASQGTAPRGEGSREPDWWGGSLSEIHLPAVPRNIIESELFGYKKGAFTGAEKDKPGLLSGAGTGSDAADILLDEIGDAPLDLQAKLLQVLETQRYMPVGGVFGDEQTVNARLLLATNRDLDAMCRAGEFREDLYWRLRRFVVEMPPLRAQAEIIPALATKLLADITAPLPVDLGRRAPAELPAADLEWARSYEWPGNIRELKHVIEHWVFLDGGRSLREIVESLRGRPGKDHVGEDALAGISTLAFQHLDDALAAGRSLASLQDLSGDVRRQLQKSVVAWYDLRKPTSAQLLALFADSKPTSIQKKISEWRNL